MSTRPGESAEAGCAPSARFLRGRLRNKVASNAVVESMPDDAQDFGEAGCNGGPLRCRVPKAGIPRNVTQKPTRTRAAVTRLRVGYR